MSTNNKKKKDQSPFIEVALALDDDFTQLIRLSGEIERLDIDSDSGLDRARILLNHFSECGLRIGEGVQKMARTLDDLRGQAEEAASRVTARAHIVQERQQNVERMLSRFNALSEMVKKVTEAVSLLSRPGKQPLSDGERETLKTHIPEVQKNLRVLIDEALAIRNEAKAGHMSALERNAESLRQSLDAVRRKLESAFESFDS
jgi:hypothetical protein